MADRTGLPSIHLDTLYWSPGWREMSREQWRIRVAPLLRQPAWVMDGNYGNAPDLRLSACDAVVLLDLAPWRCLWRVVWRRIRFHGRCRPDMGPGCNERLDWTFVRFVLGYRRTRRPGIQRQLADTQAQGKRVLVLQSPRQVEAFLARLAPG